MSRFNKFLRVAAFGLGLLCLPVVLAGLYQFLLWALRADALAGYRKTSAGPGFGLTVSNVQLLQYDGPQLRMKAAVQRVEATEDRQLFLLYKITEGNYQDAEGQAIGFEAEHATWNQASRLLEVPTGARIKNKDLDLKVGQFQYLQYENRLVAPGDIQGRFFDGQIVANSLDYQTNTGNFLLGPLSWEGMVDPQEAAGQERPPTAKAAEKPGRKLWKIKAKSSRRTGDVDYLEEVEATDGEVIVKSQTAERNIKTDVVTARGKVQYFSEDTNVLCDEAVIYRKEKRAVLTGKPVQMLIKPEDQQRLEITEIAPMRPLVPEEIASQRPPAPATDADKNLDDEVRSGKNRRKYPATVLAQRIEYWYKKGERHAVITGSPQAHQDLPGGRWRKAWASRALYDGEKELLKMLSTNGKREVRIRTSLGDDLTALWAEVSTKDGDDSFSAAEIQGDVYSDDEDVNEAGGKKKEEEKKDSSGGTKPPPLKGKIGSKKAWSNSLFLWM